MAPRHKRRPLLPGPSRPAPGDGVPINPAIAHRLLLLLAELGHPESQADVAFHLALGVEPVAPNPRDQLFRWVGGWVGRQCALSWEHGHRGTGDAQARRRLVPV